MLNEWPRFFDNLIRVENVSHGSHLLVLSARFLPGSMRVFAVLQHLQEVVNFSHSEQLPFVRLWILFRVVFCVRCILFLVRACLNSVIGASKLPYNNLFAKGLTCGYWLTPVDNMSAKGETGLHSSTMWDDTGYGKRHIGQIGVLCIHFIMLTPPVRYVQ